MTAVIITTLLAPAITGNDGFPNSSQPMYASVRSAETRFVYARGVGSSDEPLIELTMHEMADTDDPLLARQRLIGASKDPGTLAETCAAIATRVSSRNTSAATVEIVEISLDTEAFVRSGAVPPDAESFVLYSCRVP